MFNQLTPAEVVTAIGAMLRRTARNEGATTAFDRDQLMSAFSATRHLAVELASFEPEFQRFKEAVAKQIRATNAPPHDDELRRLADRLEAADGAAAGGVLCELFELLRRDDSAPARALRSDIHVQLRALADREVDLLANALG